MNLGESLLPALRDPGARRVLGIPGDFVLPGSRVAEDPGVLPPGKKELTP